MLTCE